MFSSNRIPNNIANGTIIIDNYNNVNINNGTLFINNLSNKIGICNINPNYNLDIFGNINFSGKIYNNGVEYHKTQWLSITDGIVYNNNVGIGTTLPKANLDVKGTVNISDNIKIGSHLLYVDTFNNTVGINNPNPIYELDIMGSIRFTGSMISGNGTEIITSQWINNRNGNIYYTNGNVSIGT